MGQTDNLISQALHLTWNKSGRPLATHGPGLPPLEGQPLCPQLLPLLAPTLPSPQPPGRVGTLQVSALNSLCLNFVYTTTHVACPVFGLKAAQSEKPSLFKIASL